MTEDRLGESDIATPDDLITAASDYAEKVDIDVPLDLVTWDISKRAKRRAGHIHVKLSDGDLRSPVTITLTWQAYTENGWDNMQDTIRHELVHLWEYDTFGESSHGPRFQQKADELDCNIHCAEFTTPRYEISCDSCGTHLATSHKRTRRVKAPKVYHSTDCDCPQYEGLVVHDRDEGVTWRSWSEFKEKNEDYETLQPPYRYELSCQTCREQVTTRHRLSQVTKQPEDYGCNICDSYGLKVYDHKTDRSWETNREHQSQVT